MICVSSYPTYLGSALKGQSGNGQWVHYLCSVIKIAHVPDYLPTYHNSRLNLDQKGVGT